MSDKSAIQWTTATWPIVVGCDKVSPGCRGCYAVRDAHRMASNPNPKISEVYADLTARHANGQLDWTGAVRCVESRLDWPLRWKQPRRIFVTSLGDLFHPDVPHEFIAAVFAIMAATPQHTYQVLTKRPDRMRAILTNTGTEDAPDFADLIDARLKNLATRYGWCFDELDEWPLSNVHVGTSAEDQPRLNERIEDLLDTPAAVRWLSVEPMLGGMDLTRVRCGDVVYNVLTGRIWDEHGEFLPLERYPTIDWVVAGGESGKDARPVHPEWARLLRDQCVAAGVPFFWKQHGEWLHQSQTDMDLLGDLAMANVFEGKSAKRHHWPDGTFSRRLGKKRSGRLLDGREWNQFPDDPAILDAAQLDAAVLA